MGGSFSILVLEGHFQYSVSRKILSVPSLITASSQLTARFPEARARQRFPHKIARQKVVRALRNLRNDNFTFHMRKPSHSKHTGVFQAQRFSPAEKGKTFGALIYDPRSWSIFLQGNLGKQQAHAVCKVGGWTEEAV